MSESPHVKFQDVYDLLEFTINSTAYDKKLVDKDGYILTGEGEKLKIDNSHIVLLSENISDIDANVLNPFLNERKISSYLNYYYKLLSKSILYRTTILIDQILEKSLHIKKHGELNNKKEQIKYIKEHGCNLDISPKYMDLISLVVNKIDNNTIKQFKLFQSNVALKKVENICYYGYNIREEESSFSMTYIKEDTVFKGINNNNKQLIRDLTIKILCDDDEDFLKEKASKNTHSKRYDSIIKLYFKMIKRFNHLFDILDIDDFKVFIVDENEIDGHIECLDGYSKIAHSRIFLSRKNVSSNTPSIFPTDTDTTENNKILCDAFGNPINSPKHNFSIQASPDRTYNGPSFPNIVPVTNNTSGLYGPNMMGMSNNFSNQIYQPSYSPNNQMNMGGSRLNQALM